jgi:hypothetical protein
MCCLSIKSALSTPLTDGDQTILQAAYVPVHSIGRQYARAAAYTVLTMARALPRKQSRDINTIWTTDIMALGDFLGDTSIGGYNEEKDEEHKRNKKTKKRGKILS